MFLYFKRITQRNRHYYYVILVFAARNVTFFYHEPCLRKYIVARGFMRSICHFDNEINRVHSALYLSKLNFFVPFCSIRYSKSVSLRKIKRGKELRKRNLKIYLLCTLILQLYNTK